jgi:import inner membrane translocase subunit TIM54
MIWDFFNQRQKVRSGAEAAYKLVMKTSCPFTGPSPSKHPSDTSSSIHPAEYSDLDFNQEAESFYKISTSTFPADDKARRKYYEALPAKLETARAIARGTRAMTKEEIASDGSRITGGKDGQRAQMAH